MTVIAHAGHWFAGLAYAAPVVLLLGWMWIGKLREQRARKRENPD
jgi:hypothetical protein